MHSIRMHTTYFSDDLYKEGVCPGEGVSTPGVSAWGSSGVSAQVRCLPGGEGAGKPLPPVDRQTPVKILLRLRAVNIN